MRTPTRAVLSGGAVVLTVPQATPLDLPWRRLHCTLGEYLDVETKRETAGRWVATSRKLPGVSAQGATEDEAVTRVEVLALRMLAERLESGMLPGG